MTAAAVITLDTTAPKVRVTVPSQVQPPDVATVMVVSSEPIGYSEYAFLDSNGDRHPLGAERIDAYSEFVMVPSTDLPGGGGSVLGMVADEVGNAATAVWPLYVARPRPYDLIVTSHEVYDVETGADRVYDLDLDSRTPYDIDTEQSRTYDLDLNAHEVFDIEVDSRAE